MDFEDKTWIVRGYVPRHGKTLLQKRAYSLNCPDIILCVYCRKELDNLMMGAFPICQDCLDKHKDAQNILLKHMFSKIDKRRRGK